MFLRACSMKTDIRHIPAKLQWPAIQTYSDYEGFTGFHMISTFTICILGVATLGTGWLWARSHDPVSSFCCNEAPTASLIAVASLATPSPEPSAVADKSTACAQDCGDRSVAEPDRRANWTVAAWPTFGLVGMLLKMRAFTLAASLGPAFTAATMRASRFGSIWLTVTAVTALWFDGMGVFIRPWVLKTAPAKRNISPVIGMKGRGLLLSARKEKELNCSDLKHEFS